VPFDYVWKKQIYEMMKYVSILILLVSQMVSWGQENERFLILEEFTDKKKVKIHRVKEGKKLEEITKKGAEFYGNYTIVRIGLE
jgi:hypothetical protein